MHFLFPENLTPAVPLGDTIAGMLGNQHAIAGQHLRVERQLQPANLQARLVFVVQLQYLAFVQQHQERVAERPAGHVQTCQVGLGAMVAPPDQPGVAALPMGRVVVAKVDQGRLLARQTKKEILGLPGARLRKLGQEINQHRQGVALVGSSQSERRAQTDLGIGVLEQPPHFGRTRGQPRPA